MSHAQGQANDHDGDRDPFADPAVPCWSAADWREMLDGLAAGLAHNAAVVRRAEEEAERTRARRERQQAARRKRAGGDELLEG